MDPQVKVKPGADELGVAFWRGERPSHTAPVELVSVLQFWKVMLGHGGALALQLLHLCSSCLPKPCVPLPC